MKLHPPKEPANELGQRSRQQYLQQARQVIGEVNLEYSTLYHRFAENDWAAIQLDAAVAIAALRSGLAPKEIVNLLHQGPYVQHQVHVQQVPVLAMSQYARGIVLQALAQLQAVQKRQVEGEG
jgi:hypothetical protein